VNWVKKSFVLAIVAFWALMTNHCGLEMIHGLEFLACSPQTETAPHQPTDCGDDNCATVESGLYRVEEGQIAAAKAPVRAVAFAWAILSDLTALDASPSHVPPDTSPPELARVWQFSSRAALPPRAPSFIS
jgi:hypothetical protein